MNFLSICQKANALAMMQGTVDDVTVTSGYQETLIEFCAQAWIDIQELRKDWPFMRSSVSFNTVASTTEYSLATIGVTDLARWVPGMITYINSDSYTSLLRQYSYDQYVLEDVALSDTNLPDVYAIDPVDKHLYLNPPSGAYTIKGHYYTLPVRLAADSDTPLLPPAFHMLIAYLGAAHYAGSIGNSNLFQMNTAKYDTMLGMLMRSEMPSKRVRLIGAA